MKFYKEDKPLIVGSYTPSKQFKSHSLFAIAEIGAGELVATCGLFKDITKTKEWGFDDYLYAAECIEHGQLYTNAMNMYNLLESIIATPNDPTNIEIAKSLLGSISDISEPVKRILGTNAMGIINAAHSQKHDNSTDKD